MKLKLERVIRSPKPEKKYAAIFDLGDGRKKTVHFGATGYGDFIIYSKTEGKESGLKHRRAYLIRHGRDRGLDDPTTPAALSYFITWGPHPDLKKNIAFFKRKFHV